MTLKFHLDPLKNLCGASQNSMFKNITMRPKSSSGVVKDGLGNDCTAMAAIKALHQLGDFFPALFKTYIKSSSGNRNNILAEGMKSSLVKIYDPDSFQNSEARIGNENSTIAERRLRASVDEIMQN